MQRHTTTISEHQELAEFLNFRASWLSYLAFANLAGRLLEHLGYEDVRITQRHHLKGRTHEGGVDLIATVATPTGIARVLVLIKRYDRTVSRRFVDELRGTMVRLSAPQGVILTTASFSDVASEAATRSVHFPIRLICGMDLGRLMIDARIGVIETRDLVTGKRSLEFIEEPFAALEVACTTESEEAKHA